MTERNLAVLKRAYNLLLDRGWSYRYSCGKNSNMNIRSAVSAACTELVTEKQWHLAYQEAIATLTNHLEDGVTSWEFGTHASKPRRRTEQEVLDMFDKVIRRLEFRDKKSRARISDGNSNSTL